ncbi:MAG: hypothetical protein GW794_14525, partial [Flavobacteriales bacterium]|nr:hypothetical protein [Flavobacteriales bacterium]
NPSGPGSGNVTVGIVALAGGSYQYSISFNLSALSGNTLKTGNVLALPNAENLANANLFSVLNGKFGSLGNYAFKILNGYINVTLVSGTAFAPSSMTQQNSYVLPTPPGITTASYTTNTGNALDELCYQYKYDKRNRLIEKKIPGKGWESIVYDKLDRPVLTQDANLKAQNNWLFTKYDAFGRPVYTGVYNNATATTRIQVQNLADTSVQFHFENKQSTALNINGTSVYYTNRSFPTTNLTVNTINYYDDYIFDTDGLTTAATIYGVTPTSATKSLPTGSKVRVLETSDWITTITQYDSKGRAIYVASKNIYLNTTDIIKNDLDFTGKVKATTSTHTKDSNAAITAVDTFTYDTQGRLLKQTQTINSGTTEVIAENTYDELGQLTSKGVG